MTADPRAAKWGNAIKFRKGTAEADLVEQKGLQFCELCFAVIDKNSDNVVSINELVAIFGQDDAQLVMSACDSDKSASLSVRQSITQFGFVM
jgi:hypothetical protein